MADVMVEVWPSFAVRPLLVTPPVPGVPLKLMVIVTVPFRPGSASVPRTVSVYELLTLIPPMFEIVTTPVLALMEKRPEPVPPVIA